MRSTFKILFYINKNKVKADGTTAILCRISIDGKQSVITTGIYCSPEDWNTKKGTIKIERENNKLISYRNRIENTYNHILREQGVISAELLKNTIIGINLIPTMLLQAGEVERERLRLRSIEINSTTSYRQSGISQRNLKSSMLQRSLTARLLLFLFLLLFLLPYVLFL